MLLLCSFREQPHHISKPDLKHRDFDELKTVKLRMTTRPSTCIEVTSLVTVLLFVLRRSLS